MDRSQQLEITIKDYKRKLKAREGRPEYRETVPVLKRLIEQAEAELSRLKGKPGG